MQPQSRQPYRYLHQVFFRLADRTPETSDTFMRLCRELLSRHPGLEQFTLGFRDVEMQRSVNDQQFDLSMTMIFDSIESYNLYRQHEDHHRWITLAGSMSVGRRVYDCYLLPDPIN
jgi:hypothetical protein